MNNNDIDIKKIRTLDDLNYLINKINKDLPFAEAFKFCGDFHINQLLEDLGIQVSVFEEKYFIYDSKRNLHISESEFGYIWISTMGLVGQKELTENNYVNACMYQNVVLSILMDKAISLCSEEDIYDIDSYNYQYLSSFTPGLFHNILFYFETFGKAYLSISKVDIPKTHKLSKIFSLVKDTMYKLDHNDTIFHAYILDVFKKIVNYIATIPGNFKEQYIKYDDNPGDQTVISFKQDNLNDIKNSIDLSHDFLLNYYYDKDEVIYLKNGLLNRLLDKAKNSEERERIIKKYGYLSKY